MVLEKGKKLCHGPRVVLVAVASVVFALLSAVLRLAVVILQTVLFVPSVRMAVRVAKTVWLFFVAFVGVFVAAAGHLEPENLGPPRLTADPRKSLHARH